MFAFSVILQLFDICSALVPTLQRQIVATVMRSLTIRSNS